MTKSLKTQLREMRSARAHQAEPEIGRSVPGMPIRRGAHVRRRRKAMTESERWAAYARVILEKVRVNGEPALDFIDRVMIALSPSSADPSPSAAESASDQPGSTGTGNQPNGSTR